MAVRSSRLAVGTSAAAGIHQNVYTAPAGHTAIVKDIRIARATGGAHSLNIGARSGLNLVLILSRAVPAEDFVVALTPWIVLEPGDSLTVQSDAAAAWFYYVSGTELEGVAPPAAGTLPA